MMALMVLKETDYNNYIVLVEKYLETIQFDGLVVELKEEQFCVTDFNECNQKSPVITPACIWGAKFLSLMGCFQLPMGH